MSKSTQRLANYVPDAIIRRLHTKPAPIVAATSERFDAAAMYTDFTGFTRLTERLEEAATQLGAGPEELTRVVNAYFERLIDIITAHGGDIVKFTGDGLLALWHADTHAADEAESQTLEHQTLLAAQCGLAIQTQLHNYVAEDGSKLAMRIGVGAGEVSMLHVGGVFKRWEYLLAGDLIIQASLGERQAKPGQVILSPEAFALIDKHCAVSTTPPPRKDADQTIPRRKMGVLLEKVIQPLKLPPAPAPTSTEKMENAIRRYVPHAILYKIDAGQTEWVAELRRLTVLFINLPILDQTGPHALDQAQTVMQTLQEVIYRFEGSLNKLNIDDKGITLVAAFGLPPISHEDDPARGAQAALVAQKELGKLNFQCSVGVATGLSFCGVIGSKHRREYTMMGATVNLSARLMQAAARHHKQDGLEPAILCDEPTYLAAQEHAIFDVLDPIPIKGKAEPVPIFQPLKQQFGAAFHGQAARTNQMVGRRDERFLLVEQLQAIQRGSESGIVLIEGEAGIGKSRLIQELLEEAHNLNINTLIGVGDSIERSRPYHGWRMVFQQIFDVGDSSRSKSGKIPNFARFLRDDELLRLAPLLDVVFNLDLPDNEVTAQMHGNVRADNTKKLLISLLRIACDRGATVLVMDDAQWLDSASWKLLLAASQQVHPLLLVLATRPLSAPYPPEFQQLSQTPGLLHIILDTLSSEEATTLVCQRLGVAALPAPVIRLIQNKAEGHPFYSEELAYALRDTGLLQITNGDCQLAPEAKDLTELPFPDTVQGIITSRIDQLKAPEQLTIKIASVIGRTFEYPVLHDIHPIVEDRPHLQNYLRTLEHMDITPLEAPEPDLVYIFKHIITQEVSYNLMPFSQRQQLHKEVAAWYETHFSEDLLPLYPLLAYHWSKASVPPKAVDYFDHAGEEALRGGAYQEAVRFFTEAINWAKKLPETSEMAFIAERKQIPRSELRRARWERQLGEAYLGLGQLAESQKHIKKSLELLHRPLPETPSQTVMSIATQVGRQIYHRLLPTAISNYLPEAKTALLEAARAYNTLSEIYFYKNESLPLAHAIFRLTNLAERAGPCRELAHAFAGMGFLMGVIPIHRFAQAYFRKAHQISKTLELSIVQAYVDLINALYTISIGAWDETQQMAGEAAQIYEELGDQRRWGEALSMLAMTQHFLANFTESNALYKQLHTLGRRNSNLQQQTWGLDGQASNLIRLGETSKAIRILEEAQPLLARSDEGAEEFNHRAYLAVAHLYEKRLDKALKAAYEAIELGSKQVSPVYSTLEGYAGVTEVMLSILETRQNDKRFARTTARACKAFAGYAKPFPIGRPRALVCTGMLAWLTGKKTKAERTWRNALETAREMQMPFEEGMAQYYLGRYTAAESPEGEECLRRAQDIFTRLGAVVHLAKVQEALAKS